MCSQVKTMTRITKTWFRAFFPPGGNVGLDQVIPTVTSPSCLWDPWHAFVRHWFTGADPALRSEPLRDTHCWTQWWTASPWSHQHRLPVQTTNLASLSAFLTLIPNWAALLVHMDFLLSSPHPHYPDWSEICQYLFIWVDFSSLIVICCFSTKLSSFLFTFFYPHLYIMGGKRERRK